MMDNRHGFSFARLVATSTVLLTVVTLSSCSWFGRGGSSCREPELPAGVANHPPLRAAPGLDAPDTRNAVRVPELNEPERPRTGSDPCLSRPPSYGT